MKPTRFVLHGLVLSVLTLVAIGVGFAVYNLIGLADQIAVQVLVGGLVCVFSYAAVSWVAHRLSSGRSSIDDLRELGLTYAAAFVWAPVVFVPVHFLTQGYMTSFGNVLGVWLFQLPFNLLALLVANGRLLANGDG